MVDRINRSSYDLTDALIRQNEKIKSAGESGKAGNRNQIENSPSFKEILELQNAEISFSKHANVRTLERNIQITGTDLNRLGEACSKANEKGIKEALVVMNDSAFIVNAPSKVVITVVDKNEMKNNVFTNIDGAIFI